MKEYIKIISKNILYHAMSIHYIYYIIKNDHLGEILENIENSN